LGNKLLLRIVNSKPVKSPAFAPAGPGPAGAWQRLRGSRGTTATLAPPQSPASVIANLKDQTDKPSGGIGLVNVQRRLNLLYPNQYKLDIEDNEKEHIVELSLDLTQ
jgi:hypothetical protein